MEIMEYQGKSYHIFLTIIQSVICLERLTNYFSHTTAQERVWATRGIDFIYLLRREP